MRHVPPFSQFFAGERYQELRNCQFRKQHKLEEFTFLCGIDQNKTNNYLYVFVNIIIQTIKYKLEIKPEFEYTSLYSFVMSSTHYLYYVTISLMKVH